MLLESFLQTRPNFAELGWRTVVTQILARGCSTSPVNFIMILWATSAASLPSEKAVEVNLVKCMYILKSFWIRLIQIFVSFSLSGVHPQAGGGGAGALPDLTDTEDPSSPQAVSCVHAPGGPPPPAFVSPKCHWCWVLALQWSPRYDPLAAFLEGCRRPRRFQWVLHLP